MVLAPVNGLLAANGHQHHGVDGARNLAKVLDGAKRRAEERTR